MRKQRIPDIGMVVLRENDREDWVCQLLMVVGKDSAGHDLLEPGVLCWGSNRERFKLTDFWRFK